MVWWRVQHEGVFLEVGEESGLLMGAFLWWTDRGQGCGGIRLQPYSAMESFIRDGMRLSLGMGRKSALADLWYDAAPGDTGSKHDTVHAPCSAARNTARCLAVWHTTGGVAARASLCATMGRST